MLNLTLNARPDERFHLQIGRPWCHIEWTWWGLRKCVWEHVRLADYSPGEWTSYWFLFVKWYRGTAKCDGSRTQDYWQGKFGTPVWEGCVVMTTTPKEMFSLRVGLWNRKPSWDAMGAA